MDFPGKIIEAFSKVKRVDFLPFEAKKYADLNEPLHIGFDQTNSQPSTVAFMLSLLDVQPGDKVLDVGSGSGWTTALLAYLVGKDGQVIGVEIIPGLVKSGQKNLAKYKYGWAKIIPAIKGHIGYADEAPYDRILVSAGAEKLPKELTTQLKCGGRMVIPVGNSVIKVEKHQDGSQDTEEYPGFAFVPLVS